MIITYEERKKHYNMFDCALLFPHDEVIRENDDFYSEKN